MRKKRLFGLSGVSWVGGALLIAGALAVAPGTAVAVPLADNGGGFQLDGSWTLNTGCFGGCGTWDTIEVFITSDSGGVGPFESPGIGNFSGSLAGWTGSRPNPLYALGTGPGNGGAFSNPFDLFFAGSPTGTIDLDVLFWSGGIFGTLVTAGDLTLVNGVFSDAGYQGPQELLFPNGVGYDRSVVPEPATVLLLGSGLVGLGLWRRMRKDRM